MIDNATLAEWENDLERMSAVYAPRMRDAIAEIRRLWEELESLPTWGTYRGQSAIKTVRLKLKENTAQIVSLIHERDEALAKIRRLRESQGDCALRAHDMHARCHCEPLDAALAAHRAVVRELAEMLERRHKKWCFTGQQPCEEPEVHDALAHPLVVVARRETL